MNGTLKEMVKELNSVKFDGIMFVPHPDKENAHHVETFQYIDSGDKLGGSEMGDEYEIITFKEDGDGPKHRDRFSAILIDPSEYVIRMIDCDFFGVVGKKTTTSAKFFDDIYQKLEEWA